MKLTARWEQPKHPEPSFECPRELGSELKALLGRLNICSKEYVVRQYDHEVQGGSVIKPLTGVVNDGPSDAAVVLPLLDSNEGVVVSNGICPRYSDIDAYDMAANAVDEAVRNAIAVGGTLGYLAGLDNFCWCDPVKSEKTPDGEYKLAQLVRANKALYETVKEYGIPLISGKDSMKNDYSIGGKKISIPPTLLFTAIGKINDVNTCVTMDAKNDGDIVYVLGATKDELGGSEYFAQKGFVGNTVPKVDARENKKLYASLARAIGKRLVASCHDCSDGGLGVALAEIAFSGGYGMEIELSKVPREKVERDDLLLFSESAGRFVVTVTADKKSEFEKSLEGGVFSEVGMVTEFEEFVVRGLAGNAIVREEISALKSAWQKTLDW